MKGPCKAIWDFEGIYASSRHIPGVRFVGMIHTGIIATGTEFRRVHYKSDDLAKLTLHMSLIKLIS